MKKILISIVLGLATLGATLGTAAITTNHLEQPTNTSINQKATAIDTYFDGHPVHHRRWRRA